MAKKTHQTTSVLLKPFSDSNWLRLQQLLTLKSITTYSNVDIKGKKKKKSSQLSLDMRTVPPEKWRLVSDSVVLHKWQSDCLEKWLVQGKGTVKVATGGGKTIFALATAQVLQNRKEPDLRLAVIVPTIPLMRQWRDELKDANIPESSIGLMGGEEKVETSSDLRILICVINSAREHLPALIARLNWSSKLLLIFDECHRANATKARKIFNANPRYTLGLSATPETDQGNEGASANEAYATSEVGRAIGPIIFDFSLKESLTADLLTPFEVWHIGLPLMDEEVVEYSRLSREISELHKDLQVAHRRSKSRQGFIAWCQTQSSRNKDSNATQFIGMTSERKRLIYRAKSRNNLTLRILSLAMKDKSRRAIVFHESIDEVNQLFSDSLKKKIPAVLEHSKLPRKLREENIDVFRRGIARTIISAKSLIEGFNVPSADLGIIAASSGSVRQRIQSLGRMLRKKKTNETAIIFVLYIIDTVDGKIYQDADWESVIGAKRNRYFEWTPQTVGGSSDERSDLYDILQEMREIDHPPRQYRPPCGEIKPDFLTIGCIYPAQTTGVSMKVDQAENLRLEDSTLVQIPKEKIEKIVELNKYRRAKRTPCGHLIVRTDTGQNHNQTWMYLGNIELPEPDKISNIIKLRVKNVSGRKVIAKKVGHNEVYAKGPGKAELEVASETHQSLLKWMENQEKEKHQTIHNLYWNGDSDYWIELGGERISFPVNAVPLEFSS